MLFGGQPPATFAVDRRALPSTFVATLLVKGTARSSTIWIFTQSDPAHRRAAYFCHAMKANDYYFNSEIANFKPFVILSHTSSVEMTGFEPVAFALQRRCSPAELHPRLVT